MILELVEKKYETHNSVAMINIDSDDAEMHGKITVTAPVHSYLSGVYKVWKYTDYGYVWAKTVPNTTVSYILFFNNSPDTHPPQGPQRNMADRYIYIYCLNPVRSTTQLQQVARCEIMMTSSGEVPKWYVQDQDTLEWNYTKNITYALSTVSQSTSFIGSFS